MDVVNVYLLSKASSFMALPTSFMISHSGLTMTFLSEPTMVVPTISGLAPVLWRVVQRDLTTFGSFSPRASWEHTKLSATSSREHLTWIRVLSMWSITWKYIIDVAILFDHDFCLVCSHVFWHCNENGLVKKLRNFDVTPQPIYKIQVLFPDRRHVVIVDTLNFSRS